jgi:hypothetical protein
MATRADTSYNSPMRKCLVVAGLLGLWSYPSRAAGGPAGEAEGYVDHFGGWASPQRVAFTLTQSGGPPIAVRGVSDASSSAGVGVRLGFWSQGKHPIGSGIEVSSFDIQSPVVNGEVYPLTLFLSARTALRTSKRFPNGRLQPYGFLGVSSVVLRASVHSQGLSVHLYKGVIPLPNGSENLSRAIFSPYIVGGLAWGLSPDWYVFGEWRRTEFNTTSETVNSIFWPTQRGTVSLAVRTDHYYLGLSRRFRPRRPSPHANPA